MSNICITTDVEEWIKNNCTQIADNANQEFYDELFSNLYGTNIKPYLENSSPQLEFQNLLTEVCNRGTNGQYCKKWVTQLCSDYTKKDMTDTNLKRLCGCNLSEKNYNPQIGRSCDLLCSGFDTLKYYPYQPCSGNVCIIDNVNINLINSNVGDITFTQICPYCSNINTCACIINDINIIASNTKLGNVSLVQDCGIDNSRCYDSNNVEVSCEEYFPILGSNKSELEYNITYYRNTSIIFLLMSFAFLICLIYGLYLLFTSPKNPIIYNINKTISNNNIT